MNVKEIIDLAPKKLNQGEKELLSKAYYFAEKIHEGQKRLSGDPYFTHPFETAKTLARNNADVFTIAAGLLHDTLEDSCKYKKTTEDEIKKEFGNDILFLVKGVTKLGIVKYRGYERHAESLRKFFIAIAKDVRVVMIKFADRLHNLKTLKYVREDKRKRIALESLEIYAPLANRLGMGRLKGQLEDAAFIYVYPKEYAEIEDIIADKIEPYKKCLNEAREELRRELKKNKIKVISTDSRVKHKYSLWRKLIKYDMDFDKIYDLVALRVIVKNIEECYRVLGVIHSLWSPLPGRIKDYIAVPKTNGYRSLHTTVIYNSECILEIQIRTPEMNMEAEYGIAAHFAYKELGDDLRKFDNKDKKSKLEWIKEMKDIKYIPQAPTQFVEDLKMDFFNDRIFIFTPIGDVIDLPENSIPIDFAYAIHTELGEHIAGAKINKKISSIFSTLKNGDIVEIIEKKDAHPSKKWLDYARTNLAQKNIRSYLERNTLLDRLLAIKRSRH